MSQYELAIPDGIVYACSDRCAGQVFDILAGSGAAMISVRWSADDRDVFCASCALPLGWRRASALVLHREMTPTARRLYAKVHERWWSSCCDR